jgi:hypothetical protein
LWHLTPFPTCLMNIQTMQGLPPPFVKKRSYSFVLYYKTILNIQLIKPNWHRTHEQIQLQNRYLPYYITFQRLTIGQYSSNSNSWLFLFEPSNLRLLYNFFQQMTTISRVLL